LYMDLQAYDSFIFHLPIANKKPSWSNKKASVSSQLGKMNDKCPYK
jgi:hypothetical protein